MHTLNPFKNRVTVYPLKVLALLPNRGRLPTCEVLSHNHTSNTRDLAVEGGGL